MRFSDFVTRLLSFQKRAFVHAYEGIFNGANNLATLLGTAVLWALGAATGHPINIPSGMGGQLLQGVLAYVSAWICIFVARYVKFCVKDLWRPWKKDISVSIIMMWIGGVTALICINIFGVGAIWFFATRTEKQPVTREVVREIAAIMYLANLPNLG